MLEDFSIWEIVAHFGERDLLIEMGYDPEHCYQSYSDFMLDAEFEVESDYQPSTMNEKDIYNRLLDILDKDKLSYQEWDEFLRKYE